MQASVRKWFSDGLMGVVALTNVSAPVDQGIVSLPPDHVNVPVSVEGLRYATAVA